VLTSGREGDRQAWVTGVNIGHRREKGVSPNKRDKKFNRFTSLSGKKGRSLGGGKSDPYILKRRAGRGISPSKKEEKFSTGSRRVDGQQRGGEHKTLREEGLR